MTNTVAQIVEDLQERALMLADEGINQSVNGNAFEAYGLDKMAQLLRITAQRIEKKYGSPTRCTKTSRPLVDDGDEACTEG